MRLLDIDYRAVAMEWLSAAASVEPRSPALAAYYRSKASLNLRYAARAARGTL